MTAYMMLAAGCLLWGLVAGGVLALIYAAAAMSRSQERMQRKVRQAWEEARRYRRQCQPPGGRPGPQSCWEHW
jgi:hypothetical protein